jgi:glycosyltransferase involved in cell wall biosynthesis
MSAISIVIPAHNVGQYIKQTLESVLAQTYSDFELLVYDDGSRDNTWNIIEQFAARDTRIRATQQENIGQSSTLNRGIIAASNGLVMILDADDVMLPNCVAEQIAFLNGQPQLVAAGCLARFINAQGKEFWSEKNPFTTLEAFEQARQRGKTVFFRHSGFIFCRDVFMQLKEGYRNIKQANDIDLFNRLADLGPILTNPQVLIKYRIHANQDSFAYANRLAPRLTWAWIATCAIARRSGEQEPELEIFTGSFHAQPWLKRWLFVLPALGTSYWYEARIDWIAGKKSFLHKAIFAMLLSPSKIAEMIWVHFKWA